MSVDVDEELHHRFVVNRNYIHGLASFLEHTYGRGDSLYAGLATEVRNRPAYHRINRVRLDLGKVRRFLLIAWSSENQLRLPQDLGLAPVISTANTWAPVQAYYSAFGGLQAWFAANGMHGTADDHSATLATIASMIRDRRLFPAPWNLLAVGCPMRSREFLNAPAGADCHAKVQVLSVPAPFGFDSRFWARQATWLATTREGRLRSREEEWKREQGRQRVSPTARSNMATRLAPTSLFDCLWRMRVRSNYGDVDPFMAITVEDQDHAVFNRSLCTVTSATLGLLELLVMRRIGKQEYCEVATDFVARGKQALPSAVSSRLRAFGCVPAS